MGSKNRGTFSARAAVLLRQKEHVDEKEAISELAFELIQDVM
jgi:DeoR/GlpR family transcriptional regulator of sugar metabolism